MTSASFVIALQVSRRKQTLELIKIAG